MKMNNKGFTLIEVLLSLIILVVAIVSINAAFKQFVMYKSKMDKYKNIYMTTLSIKDMILSKKLSENTAGSGELNGIKYSYKVSLLAKGFNVESDTESSSIGKGNYEIFLYKIDLKVGSRNYVLYKTQFKKVNDFEINIPAKRK